MARFTQSARPYYLEIERRKKELRLERRLEEIGEFQCTFPGCSHAFNGQKQMEVHLFQAAHFSGELTTLMTEEMEKSKFVSEGFDSIVPSKKEEDGEEESLFSWDFTLWMTRTRAQFDSPEAADTVELFLRNDEFTTVAALAGLQDSDLPSDWKNGRKRALLTASAEVKKAREVQQKADSRDSRKRTHGFIDTVEYRCPCGWRAAAAKDCYNHKIFLNHFDAVIRDKVEEEVLACYWRDNATHPNRTVYANEGSDEGSVANAGKAADDCEQDPVEAQGGNGQEGQMDDNGDAGPKKQRNDDTAPEAVIMRTFEGAVSVSERSESGPKT